MTDTPFPPQVNAGDSDSDESVSDNPEQRRTSLYTDVEVAKEEDKWVWRLRLLTVLVLIAVTVVVCVVVYQEGRKSETAAFEQDFSDLGEKLVRSFEGIVEQRFGIVESFADTITSDSLAAGNGTSTFPYVTPHNFIYRVENTAELAQLMFLLFLPRVQRSEVNEWSAYAKENTQWYTQGWAHQAGVPEEDVPEPNVFPTIMNVHNPNGPGPALKVTPNKVSPRV